MEFIINNYSINCQFKSVEEFMDSLVENTLPMLNIIKNKNYNLYKAYNTFNCILFDNVTINSFIQSSEYNKYAEISYLKRILHNFTDNPYWEDDIKTDCYATYDCEIIGQFTGDNPNCFSEALERKGFLVSLEHEDFVNPIFNIKKNCKAYFICNGFYRDMLIDFLFLNNEIGFSEFLSSKKYPKKVEFYRTNSRYCADEPFEKGYLSREDAFSIRKDLIISIEYINKGVLKSRYSDSITYKGFTYFEFRCSLSSNREFRIYYYEHKGKLVYFNSLIKKTSSLKNHVKDKTVELIKSYLKNDKHSD